MDIGTAKPTPEEQARVPHYMIDLVEPEEEYSVAEFQRTARAIIDSGHHPTVLVVGGSGLHFRAVVDPHAFPPHDPALRRRLEELSDPVEALVRLDPQVGEVVDLSNRRRVVRALEVHHLTGLTPSARAATPEAEAIRHYRSVYPFSALGIDPGPELEARIRARVEAMRRDGFLEEVRGLGPRLGKTARLAVGYRQLLRYLGNRVGLSEAWEEVTRATLGLARHQRTYFRRDPRIRWLPWTAATELRADQLARAWELS
jgi:tRNA dimethylallyltransferase